MESKIKQVQFERFRKTAESFEKVTKSFQNIAEISQNTDSAASAHLERLLTDEKLARECTDDDMQLRVVKRRTGRAMSVAL